MWPAPSLHSLDVSLPTLRALYQRRNGRCHLLQGKRWRLETLFKPRQTRKLVLKYLIFPPPCYVAHHRKKANACFSEFVTTAEARTYHLRVRYACRFVYLFEVSEFGAWTWHEYVGTFVGYGTGNIPGYISSRSKNSMAGCCTLSSSDWDGIRSRFKASRALSW